jgi:2-keto-4-pentenoate hydratase/2-oxohepta-3-ene-1,7-dioic acid hydratase in catechol pathway
MPDLRFELPNSDRISVTIVTLFNAGYAGRRQEDVARHVHELAALGVPAPSTTPSLYALPPYLAMQTREVFAHHDRTSGEGEWALVVAGPSDRDLLLTVASDHTDRRLEAHGIAWSKQAGPDVLGRAAWRLVDVANRLDGIQLTAWADGQEIQRGTLADLLPPSYWIDVLRERGQFRPGTVLLSGTIPMHHGVNQFSSSWRVALHDPEANATIECAYEVRRLPEGIG